MNNVYTYSPLDRVIWDIPSLEAIESEIERLNAKKVKSDEAFILIKKMKICKKNLFNYSKTQCIFEL